MKTTIKRRAKSAVAVLLTLCMVLSVFTVGIASASAATTDSESVGLSLGGKRIYLQNAGKVSGDSTAVYRLAVFVAGGDATYYEVASSTVSDGTHTYYYATIPASETGTNYQWRRCEKNNPSNVLSYGPNTSSKVNATYLPDSFDGNNFKDYSTFNIFPDGEVVYVDATGNSYWSSYDVSISNKSIDWYGNNMTKIAEGLFKYTQSGYWENSGSDNLYFHRGGSSNHWSKSNAFSIGQEYFDGKNTMYMGSSNEYADVGTQATITDLSLTQPTITGDDSIMQGTTFTVSVTNDSSIKLNYKRDNSSKTTNLLSDDKKYTYYLDDTAVSSNTTSTSYTIPAASLTPGEHTVKVRVSSTATGLTMDSSTTTVTVTPSSPAYCIIGNDLEALTDLDGNAFKIADPPSGGAYNSSWQSALVINNPTGTAGKYSFTFKVKEKADYEWDVQIAFRTSDGQVGLVYNNTPYNTASSDLDVPDSGITSGLYAFPLAATNAGGSLKLKQGQTYTITIDQTKRYQNSASNPWGEITITATDVYVDTVARKIDFNETTRTYEAATDAEDTIGTVSAVPIHGPKDTFDTRLTATVVNNHYTFDGWYTDAACTGTKAYDTEVVNLNNVEASATYYAKFIETKPSQYKLDITPVSGATITLEGGTDGTAVPNAQAYVGATVSIKAVITHGYDFQSWKILATATGADVTSSVLKNSTAANGTFTMPAYNVTVTATVTQQPTVRITPSTNSPTLGGLPTYTDQDYYVGDQVEITAAPTGGVFKSWQVTGGTVTSTSTSPTILTITATTVTIKAVYDYKTYQLYSDKDTAGNTKNAMYTMVRQSNGTYVSTRTVDTSTGSFTIYDVKEAKYAVPDTKDYEFNSGYTSRDNNSWSSSATTNKYKIKSGFSGEFYVVFDPNTGTYGNVSVTTTNPMGTIAQIYAKDGSIRYSNQNMDSGDLWSDGGDVTCKRGVTKVTAINGSSVANPDTSRYPSTGLSDHLKIYSAAMGSTITIETTVNSTDAAKGFYVGMFVINGWKVEATDVGKGVYRATYTLTEENAVPNIQALGEESTFEITPVYYNTNFDYITFYVDAETVPENWGKTISTCADYSGAGSPHFEGSYPGQPLGREGDMYEIKVAKYYYKYENSAWVAQTNYHPSATITAYNYDFVHHYYYVKNSNTVNDDNHNYQTYDYSDFAFLAQIDGIEAIMFRCKVTSNDNRKYMNHWNYDYTDSSTYEVLTDYYGNPIDALGNILKDGSGNVLDASTLTVTDAQVKIVSAGNVNTNSRNDGVRTKAKWATYWIAYNLGASPKKAVTMISTPADFVNTKINTEGASPQRNIYFKMADSTTNSGQTAADLEGKVTFISYDEERNNNKTLSGEDNTGVRIDGQWYYSAQHDFDSTVQVHITTNEGTTLTGDKTDLDTNSNSANNNGWIGTNSGTKATLDGKTTHTYSNVTTNAELDCTLGTGYTFVGWYLYDSVNDTYTKINDNFADLSTTMLMKKNYTIAAVVRAVGENSLVITHSKYTGSKPEAHTGTGKYYVSAKILNSDGTLNRTIDEAQNSITVPTLAANQKLQIKLRTVCNGADTFYAWYEEALNADYSRTGKYYEICEENVDPLGEREVSYEFFAADAQYLQDRKTLDFYSDIMHVSKYANITYMYYDRFEVGGSNQMVSYTVKNVELSDDEIDAGYIPNDDKIAKYAPTVVDTIYTDTKWKLVGSKVQRGMSNVTVMATQTPKNCFVSYIKPEDVASTLLQNSSTEVSPGGVAEWTNVTVPFNQLLINDDAQTKTDPLTREDFFVSAPQSYTYEGTTWNFVRFDVYALDRTTGELGGIIYSSNDYTYAYRIYADCAIYPVYETCSTPKTLTAVIDPAVLNREVYGDSANPTDKLYADLLISYINTSTVGGGSIPETIKENTSEYSIETGVILDKTVTLSDTDYNTLKAAAIDGSADTTASVIGKSEYTSQFKALATIENLAQHSSAAVPANMTKSVNDNSKLTTMNRLDKVFRYTNNEDNQKKVIAAYSYIVIRNNGTLVAYAISKPQYFNLCYIGNKPLKAS